MCFKTAPVPAIIANMKQIIKAMGLLLVLIMVFAPATGSADVYTESSKTYEAVVGSYKKITLASLDGDFEDMSMSISNEYHTELLDELTVTYTSGKNGYTLITSFTPIAAGTASFDAECNYSCDGENFTRVFHCTVSVSDPGLEELTGIYKIKISPVFKPGVKLSKSKISLSGGDHVSLGKANYFIDGGSGSGSYVPVGGESITVEIYILADDGYGFADADWQTVLINGETADLNANECTEEYLMVRADFEIGEAAPVISKHPSGEEVDEGGSCSFVARASGNPEITWYITDDDGYTVLASRAYKNFDGLKATGCDSEKLKLSNIPASLDGYYAYAVFSNEAGETESDRAFIRVNPDETPAPLPTRTPKPTPTFTPTPIPTNAPVIVSTPIPLAWVTAAPSQQPYPGVSASPETHVHQYSLSKSFDESYHFNTCSCGSKTNIEPHSFTTSESKGFITKTCTICGYTATEKVSSGSNIMVFLLIGVVVVLILIIVLGIVYLKKEGRI